MLALVGILVVIGSVATGYLMHGGNILLLFQPNEYIIIGGAALGALLVGSPLSVVKAVFAGIANFTKPGPSKKDYLDLLVMLYELLSIARREGALALESHVEEPEKSEILRRYPSFLKNHHAVHFFTDTLRLFVSGALTDPHDLENLMDVDLETHHIESSKPHRALQTMGDALPGLGIVAAVLGIVLTMQAIGGPPNEIGEKVGAALVGTFLGVLLSYGFAQPLALNLASQAENSARYSGAIKQVLLGFARGSVPAVAVEFARRSLPSDVRPGYAELEQACKAGKAAAKAAAGSVAAATA
ncbi:MAG: flagellar motor stator protein MotA [bacterium]